MAQLVFVHGVATRSGPTLARAIENRNTLFREIAFQGRHVDILSPTWGDFVPSIDPKVFGTDEKVGSFSLAGGAGRMGGLAAASAGGPAATDTAQVARTSATAAIDAVFAEALEIAAREGRALSAEDLAAFRRAVDAIEANSATAHVGSAQSDAELARTLSLTGSASFGIGSSLAKAVSAVTGRIRNAASTVAFGAVRDFVSPSVGFFLGDVFAYLRDGELRSRIRELIRENLERAWTDSQAGSGPLVVVAHSLGGVILVDMLQDPAAAGLPAGLHVDALFTVGSQPGLFRSVGALGGTQDPEGRTRKPAGAGAWFNIFDPIDPLAFRADPVFSGVQDLAFDSVTGLVSAHTTYFQRPQFYARFRSRLAGLGLQPA